MAKKVLIRQTGLRWRSLKDQGVEGLNSHCCYTEYLIKNHGFQEMKLAGGVGNSGAKVHVLHVVGKWIDSEETEYTKVLEYANILSLCGSQKWNTYSLMIYGDDLSIVDCKKCKKRYDSAPVEFKCPNCEQPMNLCEELEDKDIYSCNNEECRYRFIYMFHEEA